MNPSTSLWIVSKQGVFLKVYLHRVISYKDKLYTSSIISEMALKYSSVKNAIKAAQMWNGVVEKIF